MRSRHARRPRFHLGSSAAVAVLLSAGCSSSGAPSDSPPPAVEAAAPATAAPALIEAPAQGDVAALVREQLADAAQADRRLLVYVGATWCEPCERFKAALAAGALDHALPNVRVYAFDSDRDEARLEAAGYGSPMIPLFVMPGPDGRGTDSRFAGSIKGPAAVSDIETKLRTLLAAP